MWFNLRSLDHVTRHYPSGLSQCRHVSPGPRVGTGQMALEEQIGLAGVGNVLSGVQNSCAKLRATERRFRHEKEMFQVDHSR